MSKAAASKSKRMVPPKAKPFPEVAFSDTLYCPHCGTRIFGLADAYIGKCPHLVYAYAWNEIDFFLAVRPDYAKLFADALTASDEYRRRLAEEGMEPISRKDKQRFAKGAFAPDDPLAAKFAGYCSGFPEKAFPSLLSAESVVYKDDRLYSGVHIVLDWGI